MSKSLSNSNGRFFEYLISDYLQKNSKVTLSSRALADQKRDKQKLVDVSNNNLKIMKASLPLIFQWIEHKIQLDERTTYDRLPDKDIKIPGSGHSDIELQREPEILGISLKFNHSAVFHGRPYTLPVSCGFEKNSKTQIEFNKLQLKECKKIRQVIRPGVQFADGGIMMKYRKPWKKFMKNIVLNQANFLNKYSKNQKINSIFFNSVIGNGSQKYRLILNAPKKQLYIEDLSILTSPSSFQAEVIQKGVEYQYFLKITFDNGLILESRHKHDERIMGNHGTQIKIKPDWQVADWGDSGMKREIIKLKL